VPKKKGEANYNANLASEYLMMSLPDCGCGEKISIFHQQIIMCRLF